MKGNWRIYQNYIIIGLLSLISVFFLPMLGSEIGLGFNVPDTTAGWVVWTLTKVCIVVINMLLLDQFIKQGKVNVRNDEKFQEAENFYVVKEEVDEYLPSPKEFIGKLYRNKAITTAVTSALGVFGLTSAILQFDWVSMLTYLFTIVFGLVFGWITMNTVEEYWTITYYKKYRHDKLIEDEKKRKAEEEAKAKAEAEAKAKAEEEARLKAEAERLAAEEAEKKAKSEARKKARLEAQKLKSMQEDTIKDDTNREQLLQESGGASTEEQRGYSETLAD